ncbi:MAG TPA: hypothetical protein VNA22_03300 [Pyrinomonadaceae bacterium]|nr:hypothetical protein [Pyrinomonadaceae bacterium]
MKKQPIHQNLNTSFVNVGALVRYLRGLQFVGSIRIELASYEAEIVFTESNTIRAREYDHIVGRIAHGEQALQRILIRSKEPHGRIDVYKATEGYAGHDDGSVFIDKVIMSGAREMAANPGGVIIHMGGDREIILSGQAGENALVLAALSEFLRIVDEALAIGNLSFAAAFRRSCDTIAQEYPFMQVNKKAFEYRKGEIVVDTEVEAAQVASAVFAALRPIFRRLRAQVKYQEIFRIASERLIEVSASRRREFVRLGLMDHIEDLLADN